MKNASLETFFKFIKLSNEFTFENSKILFLRASYLPEISKFTQSTLDCLQTFKPEYNLLKKAGLNCIFEINSKYDYCWYLATNQRDENLYNFARLANATKIGGRIFVSMSNDLGPKRFQKHLSSLLNNVEAYSKNHCRIFYGEVTTDLNQDLLKEWLALGETKKIEHSEYFSTVGIFSSNKIDLGSKLLVSSINEELTGSGADFGSGFGYLSREILNKNSNIQKIYLLEAEKLALECSKVNLKEFKQAEFIWTDLTNEEIPNELDWIVMNPPFHQGKEQDLTIGKKFIQTAFKSMKNSAQLYMVANSHLPYQELLNELFSNIEILNQEKGFKIYKCKK